MRRPGATRTTASAATAHRLHRLPRRRRRAARHPPGRLRLMHVVDARRNVPDCSSCHRPQSFCVGCHQRLGVASDPEGGLPGRRPNNPFGTGTGAQAVPPARLGPRRGGRRLIANPRPNSHSLAAKRNIRTCVSCHREESCLACHSADPTRGPTISPHGPNFGDTARCQFLSARNKRACLKCHASGGRLRAGLRVDSGSDTRTTACFYAGLSPSIIIGACLRPDRLPCDARRRARAGTDLRVTSSIRSPARAEHMCARTSRACSRRKRSGCARRRCAPTFTSARTSCARAVDPSRARRRRARKQLAARRAKRRAAGPARRAHRAGHDAVQRLDARGAADSPRPDAELKIRFHSFLRDHFTNQATHMDTRLIDVLTRVAGKFSAQPDRGRLGLPVAEVQPDAAQEGPSGRARQPAHARQRGRLPDPRRRDAPGAALRALAAPRRRRVLPALAVRAQRHRPVRYWTGS